MPDAECLTHGEPPSGLRALAMRALDGKIYCRLASEHITAEFAHVYTNDGCYTRFRLRGERGLPLLEYEEVL